MPLKSHETRTNVKLVRWTLKIIVLSSHGYLIDCITSPRSRALGVVGKRSNSKSASTEQSIERSLPLCPPLSSRVSLSHSEVPLNIYPSCETVLCTVKRNYFALSNQISKLSLKRSFYPLFLNQWRKRILIISIILLHTFLSRTGYSWNSLLAALLQYFHYECLEMKEIHLSKRSSVS